MNIFSRAGCGTCVTAKTFAGSACVAVDIQMSRTSFFTETTFRRTFLTVSPKQAPGRIGINAKTAPMGQRNWQKNLSCVHIPTMISTRSTIPTRYLLFGSRPAVSMEKTSHGLVPVSFPYTPVRQESRISASTIYLTSEAREPFGKSRFLFFVKAFHPDPGKAFIYGISERSECTRISAEMSSEKAGKDQKHCRYSQKGIPLHRLTGRNGKKDRFDTCKGCRKQRRGGNKNASCIPARISLPPAVFFS